MDYGLGVGVKRAFNRAIKHKGLKMCWTCGVVKAIDRFNSCKAYGKHSKCKRCVNTVMLKFHEDNPSKRAEYASNTVRDYAQWSRTYRETNPEKVRAHREVERAVATGELHRPAHCAFCGTSGRLHGHHEDYSRPLVVRWLCPSCHRKAHYAN